MGFLITILILVYVLVCLFLIFVVLLQSGKGGGLSGLFGGGSALSDTLGASGAEKTLNRWTTYCAVGFFVIALLLTVLASRQASRSIMDEFPEEPASQVVPTPSLAEAAATSPSLTQRGTGEVSDVVEMEGPEVGVVEPPSGSLAEEDAQPSTEEEPIPSQ